MGNYKRLIEFVRYVKKHYPAKHYALIIWNHGSGIMDPKRVYKKDTAAGMVLVLFALSGLFAQGGTEKAAPAAQTGKKLIVVGYAQVGAESDWRTANTKSFKSTFTEENGYKLIFDDAQQKQENQIKAIRSFIQQDVDYIVVAPVVETGWETVLKEAKDAGIPVILSDRQMKVSDDSLYTCWVGGNFVKEGLDSGDWLAAYLKKQGREKEDINIVTLQGTIGASAQVGRTEGFGAKLKEHPNWHMNSHLRIGHTELIQYLAYGGFNSITEGGFHIAV